MKLLVLGTSSGAGKTTFCAMLCRYLKNHGIDCVPFKGSNLSCDSFTTKDGGQIGVGQQFQALAAGLEPETDMNPILLKPVSKGHIKAVVDGKEAADVTPDEPLERGFAMEHVHRAFDRLYSKHEFIVCEGSGAPSEINLYDRDLANTGLMREMDVPAVLVADIEKGGVFAAIYGTWLLMPDDLKHNLKGFVINRFRGEPSILKPGIEKIEELTGMKCVGILPYEYLRFPSEDSLSVEQGKLEGDDTDQAFLDNLDEMISHAERDGFGFDLLMKFAE